MNILGTFCQIDVFMQEIIIPQYHATAGRYIIYYLTSSLGQIAMLRLQSDGAHVSGGEDPDVNPTLGGLKQDEMD